MTDSSAPASPLAAALDSLAGLDPGIIGATGGSGTRVVGRIVRAGGMYIGTNLNDYQDALDLGGYSDRWINEFVAGGELEGLSEDVRAEMVDDLAAVMETHRRDLPADARAWGWKEPRSIYLLPFFNSVMPGLRFVHWMRDGRDMAFSENQHQLRKHGDTVLGADASAPGRSQSRSIALWSTVNTWAADFGEQQLRDRYMRVRFEDLCAAAGRDGGAALRVPRARGRHRAGGRRGAPAGHARPLAEGASQDARPAARGRLAGSRAPRLPRRVGSVQRPILVTGAHRSGTTWVGAMLALSPRIGLIHEPFSPITPPGISSAPFDRFFFYVTDENEGPYVEPLRAHARLPLRPAVASSRRSAGPRDAARAAQDFASFAISRARRARPLLKDPIAVFSSEWLASRFDAQVIALIRHPAAFASSVTRLGWTHDFALFLDQPLLLRDHLAPFEDEIRDYAAHERDAIDQAILLWRLIYSTVATFRERHPEWTFVRHEDLSRAPVPGLRRALRDARRRGRRRRPEGDRRPQRRRATRSSCASGTTCGSTARRTSSRGGGGSSPGRWSGSGGASPTSRRRSTPRRTGVSG